MLQGKGFIRPGTQKATAFGYAFDLDRDADEVPPLQSFSATPSGSSAARRRRELPVYAKREQFLRLVEQHSVVIVVGETGSGKTTQLPQYLLEAGWADDGYQIVCTQPRRVAAATIAQRVAEEVGCAVGETVGFAVRFQNAVSQGRTRVKFATDGSLLREVMDDPLLSAYSVVVVDEAHERAMPTDLLLGLLRKILRQRPHLRVIVSSATLQAEKLALFFAQGRGRERPPGAPDPAPAILTVEGRCYPVQLHYLRAPCSNYLNAAVTAVLEIHRAEVPGDVLVFLSSQEEIESCIESLQQQVESNSLRHLRTRLLLLPFYSGLPAAQQMEVFKPCPRGCRRVILATNVAETSVTLDGVVYVVDTLFAKQRGYNPVVGLDCLLVAPISKASARQRAGRAGRVRPGHCFRLCTEAAFEELAEHAVPEIQRSHLAAAVLQLKAMGIDNIMTFAWLDAPPAEAAVRALELLHAIGAINAHARLTADVGLRLAELPLEPQLARALLASGELGCSEEVATIAALMSVRTVWAGAPHSQAFVRARSRFAVAEGDPVTYLNVWRAWEERGRDAKWAYRHYVHHKSMLRASDVRRQLVLLLQRLGVPLVSCGADSGPVSQALLCGFFTSAARYEGTDYDRLKANDPGTNIYRPLRAVHGQRVRLAVDAKSVLSRCRPEWVVFAECQQSGSGLWRMGDVMATDAAALQRAAPHFFEWESRR